MWANPTLWTLSKPGKIGAVSGVPPDAFSETGQLWGSPLYDWPAHAAEGYKWRAHIKLHTQFQPHLDPSPGLREQAGEAATAAKCGLRCK